jgi:hypothetical protein
MLRLQDTGRRLAILPILTGSKKRKVHFRNLQMTNVVLSRSALVSGGKSMDEPTRVGIGMSIDDQDSSCGHGRPHETAHVEGLQVPLWRGLDRGGACDCDLAIVNGSAAFGILR